MSNREVKYEWQRGGKKMRLVRDGRYPMLEYLGESLQGSQWKPRLDRREYALEMAYMAEELDHRWQEIQHLRADLETSAAYSSKQPKASDTTCCSAEDIRQVVINLVTPLQEKVKRQKSLHDAAVRDYRRVKRDFRL